MRRATNPYTSILVEDHLRRWFCVVWASLSNTRPRLSSFQIQPFSELLWVGLLSAFVGRSVWAAWWWLLCRWARWTRCPLSATTTTLFSLLLLFGLSELSNPIPFYVVVGWVWVLEWRCSWLRVIGRRGAIVHLVYWCNWLFHCGWNHLNLAITTNYLWCCAPPKKSILSMYSTLFLTIVSICRRGRWE